MAKRQYGPNLSALYTGPFFTKDPRKTVRQNFRVFISDAMESAYKVALQNRPPRRTGSYEEALSGPDTNRMYGTRSGRKWELTGVMSMAQLSAPWPGTRSGARYGRPYFNYAGKVEKKYRTFSKARRHLYRVRAKNAELLRGLT